MCGFNAARSALRQLGVASGSAAASAAVGGW